MSSERIYIDKIFRIFRYNISHNSILLDHIASHGFVVISPFTYTSIPTFEYKAEWMEKVDQWAQENLINKIKNEGVIYRELT